MVNQEQLLAPLVVSLKSDTFLNFNVNSSIISNTSVFISKINQDFSCKVEGSDDKSKINFEYEIFNHLDCAIKAKINFSGNNEFWTLKPKESIKFTQFYIDKLFALSNPSSKSTCLTQSIQTPTTLYLEVSGFNPVTGLIIEEVLLSVFWLQNGLEVACCAIDVSFDGNMRKIKIIPPVQLANNTDLDLKFQSFDKKIEVLKNSAEFLPLKWCSDLQGITILNSQPEQLSTQKFLVIENKYYVVEFCDYETDSEFIYRTIQINPSFGIINLLPEPIKINSSGVSICELKIGEQILLTDELANNQELELIFYNNQEEFITEPFVYSEKPSVIPLKNMKKSSIKLENKPIDFRKNSKISLLARNQTEKSELALSSKLLCFYSEHIILNTTDYDLIFSGMSLPKHS